MALSITKVSASAHRIRYILEETVAAADAQSLPLATMITDAADGPLKDRLTALAAAAYQTGRAFFTAFFDDTDGQLSIIVLPATAAALPANGFVPSFLFDLDGSNLPIIDICVSGVTYTYFDIVYNHSLTR